MLVPRTASKLIARMEVVLLIDEDKVALAGVMIYFRRGVVLMKFSKLYPVKSFNELG